MTVLVNIFFPINEKIKPKSAESPGLVIKRFSMLCMFFQEKSGTLLCGEQRLTVSVGTHHVRSDFKHQRKRVAQCVQRADD